MFGALRVLNEDVCERLAPEVEPVGDNKHGSSTVILFISGGLSLSGNCAGLNRFSHKKVHLTQLCEDKNPLSLCRAESTSSFATAGEVSVAEEEEGPIVVEHRARPVCLQLLTEEKVHSQTTPETDGTRKCEIVIALLSVGRGRRRRASEGDRPAF